VGNSHVSPNPAQFGAGGVQHIPSRANSAVDIGFEIRQLGQMVGKLPQVRESRLNVR
jgi:hypothetical protein